MEITVLGDVISILKHAKEVQSKRSTDKVLKSASVEKPIDAPAVSSGPSKPTPTPKKIIRLVDVDKPAANTQQIKEEKSIASRLGPPNEQRFRNVPEATAAASKKPVFSRLDRRVSEDDASPVRDRSKSPGILRKRIRDDPEDIRNRITLKRPSERTHDKRVSFNSSSSADEEEPLTKKKKKYVMVQTLADGSRVKKIIDPADPILQKYQIQKKSFSTSSLPESKINVQSSSLFGRIGKKISPPRDIRDRIGSKADESLNADREQQKSVKSRLSMPVSIRRLSSPSSRYF